MGKTLSKTSESGDDLSPGRYHLNISRNSADRQPGHSAGSRRPSAIRRIAAFLIGIATILSPDAAFALPPMGEHYSPQENLETIDIRVLESARRTIDIAMYAFTDRALGDLLLKEAAKGIRIRIYRDKTQIRDRGDQTRRFLGQKNMTFRIKGNGPRNIMHLKAYAVDGTVLRTGSANWSAPGEGAFRCRRHPVSCRTGRLQQDNNLFLANDPVQAGRFEKTFERLWSRRSNVSDPESFVRDAPETQYPRKRHEHRRFMY